MFTTTTSEADMLANMKIVELPGPNPGCDICKVQGHSPVPDAVADVPTTSGPWAYLCKKCMRFHHAGTMGTRIVWK